MMLGRERNTDLLRVEVTATHYRDENSYKKVKRVLGEHKIGVLRFTNCQFSILTFNRFIESILEYPLTRLEMDKCDLNPAYMMSISKLFKGNYLETIALRESKIGDNGLEILADVIKDTSWENGFDKLDLFKNGITAAGTRILADALHERALTTRALPFRKLDLSANQLGDGVIALAESFIDRYIDELQLIYTDIGVNEARALYEALWGSETFHRLDVSANKKIGHEGAVCLLPLMSKCDEFKHLGIGMCDLTDAFIPELINAIRLSKTIEVIVLSGNTFTDAGFRPLIEAVRGHPSLRLIKVEQCKLSARTQADLKRAIQRTRQPASEEELFQGLVDLVLKEPSGDVDMDEL